MKKMKYVGYGAIVIAVLVVLFSLAFGAEWLGLKWEGFFAPRHEAVRREVFKETRSYNEGKLQDLVKLKYEYESTSDEIEKKALANRIRGSFAEYDENKIESPELKAFLKKIKYGSAN